MKKIFNGKFLVSISIKLTRPASGYHMDIIKGIYLWPFYVRNPKKYWYGVLYKDRTAEDFGWEASNHQFLLINDVPHHYPVVTMKFVDGQILEKTFKTDEEAQSYYKDNINRGIEGQHKISANTDD